MSDKLKKTNTLRKISNLRGKFLLLCDLGWGPKIKKKKICWIEGVHELCFQGAEEEKKVLDGG